MKKEFIGYGVLLLVAFLAVAGRSMYEKDNPVILGGNKAEIIAIASTGKDINSPVSYLFGRAPYYIICDRAKKTYKAVPNKFMDAQHAAGLRSAKMIAGYKVDAVLGNNVGFEPYRVFEQARIEVYTDLTGTAWDALNAFPDGLTRLTAENVPAHFGITGSKTPIACNSFDASANIGRIVQGKFLICPNCNYRVPETSGGTKNPTKCPKCGGTLTTVVAVTQPGQRGALKPSVKVL
ncbi:MAG: hypothetical protein HQL30_09520 [Candidatus Omnitrophica bacterium]|nr:hypothetical protein [Candidatus Omnitrophota bacterium]